MNLDEKIEITHIDTVKAIDKEWLNTKVEIIEEDKKIEKLKSNDFGNNENFDEVDSDIYFIVDKINEIIDKLNKD